MAVPVRVAIESSLRRFGIVRKVKRSQAVFMWNDIVGSPASNVSEAVSCRGGVLFVEVKNSVWAAELSLLKRDIIKKLNRYLGRGTIKDIRFKATGREFPDIKEKGGEKEGTDIQIIKKRPLSRKEAAKIEEFAQHIEDISVKAAFIRFAITTEETRVMRNRILKD
mgnify:CR=1 FL=1